MTSKECVDFTQASRDGWHRRAVQPIRRLGFPRRARSRGSDNVRERSATGSRAPGCAPAPTSRARHGTPGPRPATGPLVIEHIPPGQTGTSRAPLASGRPPAAVDVMPPAGDCRTGSGGTGATGGCYTLGADGTMAGAAAGGALGLSPSGGNAARGPIAVRLKKYGSHQPPRPTNWTEPLSNPGSNSQRCGSSAGTLSLRPTVFPGTRGRRIQSDPRACPSVTTPAIPA